MSANIFLNAHNSLVARSTADDIREAGWAVAVHNDYRQGGVPMTFWLFTKGNVCVKGEGKTDAEALDQIRAQLETRPRDPTWRWPPCAECGKGAREGDHATELGLGHEYVPAWKGDAP